MKLFKIKGKTVEELPGHSYRDQEIGGFGEKTLHQFIIDHLDIIPGDEIDTDNPVKFILIRNEAPVTTGAMDLLLVDQNGVPTILEVKLADNSEIRRSIIGQGLDYLAHLKAEWSGDRLVEAGKNYWENSGKSFGEEVKGKLDLDLDELIKLIDQNFHKNMFRIIFVADKIPKELRLMIEFLHETSVLDVYGLEVGYYRKKSADYYILAPNLIKSTSKSNQLVKQKWNYEQFIQELSRNAPEDEVTLAKDLLKLGNSVSNNNIEWGAGKGRGSFTAGISLGKDRFNIFSVYTTGFFSVNIGWKYKRFEKLNLDISEKYRKKYCQVFGKSVSQKDWQNSWMFLELNKLLNVGLDSFVNFVNEYVQELSSILEQENYDK